MDRGNLLAVAVARDESARGLIASLPPGDGRIVGPDLA
jgi:hypothetical protein